MNKWILLILAGMLMLSGCVMDRAAMMVKAGKLDEFTKQSTATGYANLNANDFTYTCLAYNKLKNYEKFFSCVDAFEKQFANKRYEVFVEMSGWPRPYIVVDGGINYFLEQDLADAYFSLEDFQSAVLHADKALELMQWYVDNDSAFNVTYIDKSMLRDMPRTWQTAAIASIRLGDDKKPLQYINKLEKHDGGTRLGSMAWDWVIRNNARNALIRIYLALGMPDKAKKAFDALEGENLFNKLNFWEPVLTGKSLDEIRVDKEKEFDAKLVYAELFTTNGDSAQAVQYLDSVLADPQAKELPSYLWVALFNRAKIHYSLGELAQATEKLQKAINIIEAQRSSITSDVQKMGFAGDKQAVYSDLVTALMDAGRFNEAFAYAERGKARALVDMLASKKQFGGGDAMSASEQNQLLAQLDTTEAKARVVGTVGEASTTRSVVVKNRTALSQQAPELSSLVTVDAPDVKEIQRLLPQGETLIEYYGSGDNLFAFVVTADGIRGVKLNGKGLADDVTAFREAILNPQGNGYQQSGNRLYSRLIAPVASGISTQNLTIVAHGALHYLPFSALTSSKGFLIDQYNLRILPSASVMKFLKSNQNKSGSLLALGNPDLGEAKYDLPFAQKEAIRVSNGVKGSKLLVRADATETAVKSYGNSFRYLHFASHGTFDAEKPLNSGLLLAKDAENDGMLTVGELYDLNLNADLVTLSACETALGKVANGDDVVGFTRGFLYAGASSIVSSLWQVDDAATSDLMTGFYANLSTTDKRSALRNAQIATKAKYKHPYYWAAFQITGAVQ